MSEVRMITLEAVCDRLQAARSVLILTHMRPDGDTLGSAVGVRELVRGLGKSAEIINADDSIPKRLQFIVDTNVLTPDRLPEDFAPDLTVSVDVSAPHLFGELAEEYAPRTELAIDHHVLGTPFAKETYVGDVGACGEIIVDMYRIFKERGHELMTKKAATALWAAICSDTGSFKYEAVSAETHRRIAELMDAGINHAEIARRLYDSKPMTQVIATKLALNTLRFYHNTKIATVHFTQQMLRDNGLTREDIEEIIGLTRGIEGVEVGVSVKQSDTDPTLFKVSMRSNRVADVAKLCAVFGGGGHVRAGGCTVNAPDIDTAEAMLIKEIEKELDRLEAEGAFEGADAL